MDRVSIRQPGIIGTGRVARALSLALGPLTSSPHGNTVPMIWGRSFATATAAARAGGGTAVADLATLAASCDVIAIAVSDAAIAEIVAILAATGPLDHAFVFHTSGSAGAAILSFVSDAGARTAAIHPAMTFTGNPAVEVARMAGASFAVTGATAEADAYAQGLVAMLGGVPVAIAEEHRTLYHAALSHAANHLVTLIAGAARALAVAGVDDPGALLAPLVRAALDNGLDHGIAGLSGPLLRGDARTIDTHLTALKAHCPDVLAPYRAMATATLDELERQDPTLAPAGIRKLLGQS